jgi:hypothetical protein
MRYEFMVAKRLSDRAAAAFPELARTHAPSGHTRLYGEVHDRTHFDQILTRISDMGLDLIDVHQLPD